MSAGLLVLQLFLCSFSTSISNGSIVVASGVAAGLPAGLPADFPANIVVQAALRAAVAQLWEGSPTFRAQCRKIGADKRYRVAVVLEPSLHLTRSWRAQCLMRVYSTGFVTARVMVPQTRQVTELIPHELEHVIEHIEGINVKRDAARSGTGAYDAGSGRIETTRAVRVGVQARQELESSRGAVALITRR